MTERCKNGEIWGKKMKKHRNFNGFPLRFFPKTGTIGIGKPDDRQIILQECYEPCKI
jgi:hypothetical protein